MTSSIVAGTLSQTQIDSYHVRMGLSPGNSSPARSLSDPVSISDARLLEI